MNAALCSIPDHGDHRTTAETGYLCRHHLDQLRDWLIDLEQWWTDWTAHLDEYHVTDDGQPHDASIAATDPRTRAWHAGHELHGNTTVRANTFRRHLNPLSGILESNGPDIPDVAQLVDTWSQVLAEEASGVTQPASVIARVALLRHRVGWIAGQPWVDEMFDDVRKAQRAMAAAVTEPSGPVPCGPCPYCGTLLHTRAELERWNARRQLREPKQWDTERVQCTNCGRSWEGTEVARLRIMQEAG